MLKLGIVILTVGIANVLNATLCNHINIDFISIKKEVVFTGRGHIFFLSPYNNEDIHVLQT